MPTSAAVLMMVIVSAVSTVTVLTMMMMSTTATSASEYFDEMVNLLLRSLAVLANYALESQRLTGQRVISVNSHSVFFNLRHLGMEIMPIRIIQGDDGSFVDVIVVEVAVDGEDLTLQLVNTFWHVFAEGLCGFEGEVEGRILLQGRHLLLETVKCETET